MNLRKDPGRFAVTKDYRDFGKFITPTLREISRTAPYMHNGMLSTLESVVEFYDRGGGRDRANRSKLLKPLGLSDVEKTAMVEFLKTLSGDPIVIRIEQKDLPKYRAIDDWFRKKN